MKNTSNRLRNVIWTVVKITLAIFLLMIATTSGIGEILSIVDPVGTKMADDGDPFGDPRTPLLEHAISIGIIMASVGGAVLLLRGRKKV